MIHSGPPDISGKTCFEIVTFESHYCESRTEIVAFFFGPSLVTPLAGVISQKVAPIPAKTVSNSMPRRSCFIDVIVSKWSFPFGCYPDEC